MKLTHLNIQNFIGARAVNVKLTKPVALFAGHNGAGKSSLQEAVRMALTGEFVRVGLKKEFGQLVTEGQGSGFAEVEINGTTRTFVTLPDGKTTPMTDYLPPAVLPYVLDAQRFTRMEANERRGFLFGLMGLSANGDEVKTRLIAKGCNETKIEAVMPLLRTGFDTACKESQGKARDSKSQWKSVTEALAPDGIPGEMLAEALTPLNERLAYSANEAQWTRINVGRDMRIYAAEEGAQPRDYALLSESEKWRADAMIAEAVSHLSGLKLLVLDRFDVLDLAGRADLIAWLETLAQDNEIDTALIFGTLKALPAQLPDCIEAYWLENGVI